MPGWRRGERVVAAELLLEQSVDTLGLLLLTKLTRYSLSRGRFLPA
jgi:hypothetical protein